MKTKYKDLAFPVLRDIYEQITYEDHSFPEVADFIMAVHNIALDVDNVRYIYNKFKDYMGENSEGLISTSIKDLVMPEVMLDMGSPHIRAITKKVTFIDIETSLIPAHVFRTGLQTVNAHQMTGTTKILTVAGGSMYDLYNDGSKAVWAYSNHHDKAAFAEDPLDDRYVLEKVWHELNNADVIVAHNARFDKGWLEGRFLELNWKLPSKYVVICTYRNLYKYNLTSKKLQELSSTLIGTAKISTDFDLWMRCSQGDVKAFEEMTAYNIGDIYDTLFKVYMRTCQYAPQKCVDLTDHSVETPQCRVTGRWLEKLSKKYVNHSTGLEYNLYWNPDNGLHYQDRCTTASKKSGIGKIKHYI
jgi:hypothetical protein